MNPDLLADGRANLRFDAFNEAHADPAKFIGRADGGGNFQRSLFHLAPAKVRVVLMFLSVPVISVVSIICFLVPSLIHSTTPLFYQAHFCQTANLTAEPLKSLTEIIVVNRT
jgi:hypothetical protein